MAAQSGCCQLQELVQCDWWRVPQSSVETVHTLRTFMYCLQLPGNVVCTCLLTLSCLADVQTVMVHVGLVPPTLTTAILKCVRGWWHGSGTCSRTSALKPGGLTLHEDTAASECLLQELTVDLSMPGPHGETMVFQEACQRLHYFRLLTSPAAAFCCSH